jgi:hypothetical protein
MEIKREEGTYAMKRRVGAKNDLVGVIYKKKGARIEIQPVFKIQYPMKNRIHKRK